MGFSRQEYWNGLPFPSPGDLPNPGIEPASPASPALADIFFTAESRGKPLISGRAGILKLDFSNPIRTLSHCFNLPSLTRFTYEASSLVFRLCHMSWFLTRDRLRRHRGPYGSGPGIKDPVHSGRGRQGHQKGELGI